MPGCSWPSNWATVVLPEAACSTPKSPVVLPGGWSVGPRNPCVLRPLISLHAHANDCCRLPYRRTRHAVRRGSPRRHLLSFQQMVPRCRDGLSPTPEFQSRAALAPIGCRVNVSPPGCTLCRAVATCCTVLHRVPRLEALLRASTLHECLKETGYVLEENSKVSGPKF